VLLLPLLTPFSPFTVTDTCPTSTARPGAVVEVDVLVGCPVVSSPAGCGGFDVEDLRGSTWTGSCFCSTAGGERFSVEIRSPAAAAVAVAAAAAAAATAVCGASFEVSLSVDDFRF